jgi:tetratricopeptide (TPR) repeat protein
MDDSDDTVAFPPETHLAALGPRFVEALRLREEGRTDAAVEALQGILRVEPRLAEPRMELARIWLDAGRLDDAESEIREAIRLLETGAQWTDDLPESVVLALAWALLGEVLKERAATDDVVFGPEEGFRTLIEQSGAAYARAHALDPSDTYAGLLGHSMGPDDDDGDDDDDLPAARRARREMTGDLLDEDPDES